MTITINNRDYTIPQLNTKSWKDGISWLKYITDKSPRIKPVRSIIVHTHEGLKSALIQGVGAPSSTAQALARYQVNTDREVSWDYTVDSDGSVLAQNDPAIDYSWQAGSINPVSLGIQNTDGIPGPETVRKLKAGGMKNGLWVSRPIDDVFSF